MIICKWEELGRMGYDYPMAICLSNDIYEYRKHRSIVKAPLITIDLYEGKVMAGPMKYDIEFAGALYDAGILKIPDSQFRYLAFCETARSYNICRFDMCGQALGPHILFGRCSSLGYPIALTVKRTLNNLLEQCVFGDYAKQIYKETHEWLDDLVHFIVMNGKPTGKQMNGSEVVKTDEDLI